MIEAPLPTFLIIGAQKSATHWLRLNLGLHPDVFSADGEPAFFNNGRHFEKLGIDWYRERFAGWSGEPIVGESTPGYMFWRHHTDEIAERVRSVLPDVRLLAILRNPVDRAQSAVVHHIKMGALDPETNLLDRIRSTPPEQDELGLISGGWYATSLAPYIERFGDQLLVLILDDAIRDPFQFYGRTLRHVGASPGFVPAGLEVYRHTNQHPRRPAPGPQRARLTAAEREELYSYFVEDVGQLELLLDRDLSMWHP